MNSVSLDKTQFFAYRLTDAYTELAFVWQQRTLKRVDTIERANHPAGPGVGLKMFADLGRKPKKIPTRCRLGEYRFAANAFFRVRHLRSDPYSPIKLEVRFAGRGSPHRTMLRVIVKFAFM